MFKEKESNRQGGGGIRGHQSASAHWINNTCVFFFINCLIIDEYKITSHPFSRTNGVKLRVVELEALQPGWACIVSFHQDLERKVFKRTRSIIEIDFFIRCNRYTTVQGRKRRRIHLTFYVPRRPSNKKRAQCISLGKSSPLHGPMPHSTSSR